MDKTTYQVETWTSSARNAGTDATITVRMRGTRGVWGLEHTLGAGPEFFAAGAHNDFLVQDVRLGDLLCVDSSQPRARSLSLQGAVSAAALAPRPAQTVLSDEA